jgi:hypothetical protein
MDVNSYTRSGIVSPSAGFTQPEILQQAKQALFDQNWQLDRKRVAGLLDRSIPSPDGDQEAYRLLLVAACNYYAREMDFLFESISDYTELLMPEDLLSSQSVLQAARDTLTPEVCQDVEVIGWLYQFYISEKKDQVMGAKGSVSKEDIPAVTQLFTPEWIVQYMVQNSLGRLWLLNHPGSAIRALMAYYIEPAQPETDFPRVDSPEDLKLLDPACGSGHILTYAFNLLYTIYEEQGYDAVRIPQLILQKNLYGIEIDKRAAQLASFALVMKARQKDKRFFSRGLRPNILEMLDVSFTPQDVNAWVDKLGQDLYTQDLWEGMRQFENAKTFGSLIRPAIKDVPSIRARMQETGVYADLLLSGTSRNIEKVLEMSEYLSSRYQVVVANPPYFSKGMDNDYKQFAQENYPDSKSDTLSMFMERNLELASRGGYVGMITLMSWMFLSSFEKLREKLLSQDTLLNMAHLGARAFDTIGGEVVSTTMFTLRNAISENLVGEYFRLIDGGSEAEKLTSMKEAIANPDCGWFFKASAADFKKIPGAPIVYWFSDKVMDTFQQKPLGQLIPVFTGMATSDNSRFLRFWFEVNEKNIDFSATSIDDTKKSNPKWYPYNKGGERRRWYGNFDYVVNFSNNGQELKDEVNRKYPYLKGNVGFYVRYEDQYFKEGITWSAISSGKFSARIHSKNSIFSNAGFVAMPENNIYYYMALLNTNFAQKIISGLSPTLNFNASDISKLPVIFPESKYTQSRIENLAHSCLKIAKGEWDIHELSWDFKTNSLLSIEEDPLEAKESSRLKERNLQSLTNSYYLYWENQLSTLIDYEQNINSEFNRIYSLEDEFTEKIDIGRDSLTNSEIKVINGKYVLHEENTITQFLSYAVGCMFGRYSLDKPGLILANQGETLQDYLQIIGTEPTFTPSPSNIIPILDGDWFEDDITSCFKHFLKITFGMEHYEENLRFIEKALGKDLRKYFLKDFYKNHVQTYKKRPIYWLFSSPKGSFNCLIYMHRYTPDTVSVILNQYLREYREKLSTQRRYLESLSISQSSSPREKTVALKESESLARVQAELKSYEDDLLFPLAGQHLSIDPDDGVLVNYAKFGEALRKIF